MVPREPDEEGPLPLVEGELVDDRSLEEAAKDDFRHLDFVRELAGLVLNTRTPANIALFGAWGSGKSGIANLLREELPDRKSELRFVLFDASKYAEAPLRRHFISQVATGLELTDDKYHSGLYTGTEGRSVKFNGTQLKQLAWWFVETFILVLAALFSLATLAALTTGDFEHEWASEVRDFLRAGLPISLVLTALVKLAVDGFTTTTNRTAPSGEEEFEERFKDLVGQAKTKRLVVFVDELDRCSPEQVASALETIKTFLFVKKCVFVVAADQQVIEQALRRKVRQHTPEDVTNPYYSAGSSYLDKVFQYQLTLPPLKARTLSRYALSEVSKLPGVWRRIPNLDEVVSVLIATHVVSPRRVKVLLNRYAIAYRLVERRAADGHLDPDVASRATELAKLVCLQCEFPLFAEDLTLDARLPELVRMAADGEELPSSATPVVQARAGAYARGERMVAELLVFPGGHSASEASPATTVGAEEGDSDHPDDVESLHEGEEPEFAAPERADAVARQHAEQLVNYLRKTKFVAGPGRDLIYLESAGVGQGIDAVSADRLELAATDNNLAEVLVLVRAAASDGQGIGALRVLADFVRQAAPGIEGRNITAVLLQSIEQSGVDLSDSADYLADAVVGHIDDAQLGEADLLGALKLSRASGREVGEKLLIGVVEHPASRTNAAVASALLASADSVPSDDALWPNLVLATRLSLLSDPEVAADRLMAMPAARAQQLLDGVAQPLYAVAELHDVAAKQRAEDEDFEAQDLLDPTPVDALASVFDALTASDSPLVGPVALLALGLDSQAARDSMETRLKALAPITEISLALAVLAAAGRRHVSRWPYWLGPLGEGVIAENEGLMQRADRLASTLWRSADLTGDSAPSWEQIERTLTSLGRAAAGTSVETDLVSTITDAMGSFTTDSAVDIQRELLERAKEFENAGLIRAESLADIDLAKTIETLQASPSAGEPSERVGDEVVRRANDAALRASTDKLVELMDVAGAADWLRPGQRGSILMTGSVARRQQLPNAESLLSTSELRELAEVASNDVDAANAVSLWLANFATGEEAWFVLQTSAASELSGAVAAGLKVLVGNLDPSGRWDLLDSALRLVASAPVDGRLLDAMRLSEAPPKEFRDRLVDLSREIGDDVPGQERVLDVWRRFGPSTPSVDKALVEQVYVPMVNRGGEYLDLALVHFSLVQNVKGVRNKVRDALRAAARTDEQKNRVDDRLMGAGWTRKRYFGLGPTEDKPEDD